VATELRRAKENPKVALAFGAAFVGRGDLVIVGTFLPLWAMQMGLEDGMTTGQAMGQAGILLFVNQAAVSGWAYFAGMMNDRFDKISVLALSFTFAAVGYFGLWLIADPFNSFVILAIVILAMGEVSITVTSNSVIGEYAPQNSRGATLGVFGVMGAVGITVAMFIGGEIFDAVGKTAPFMMMVGFNAVIIAWALLVRLSENKQRASATATTPSGGD
jgi:MFS family permease